MKKHNIMIRRCRWCGTEYLYTPDRWYDYCSPKCKYEAELAER
jgi:endogenous inhibitor of DNA gyrase (YacG/DUF329 family)